VSIEREPDLARLLRRRCPGVTVLTEDARAVGALLDALGRAAARRRRVEPADQVVRPRRPARDRRAVPRATLSPTTSISPAVGKAATGRPGASASGMTRPNVSVRLGEAQRVGASARSDNAFDGLAGCGGRRNNILQLYIIYVLTFKNVIHINCTRADLS